MKYKMQQEIGDKVKVTFVDNQVLIGKVVDWVIPGDSEDNLEELSIIPDENQENGNLKGLRINFNETEVYKVEKLN